MLHNFSITNFIWFHANHYRNLSSPSIKIANKVTQWAGSTTFLVLTIDDCLSWDAHVNNLSKKFNSGVYSLRRIIAWVRGLKNLKTIDCTYIQTHLLRVQQQRQIWEDVCHFKKQPFTIYTNS